MKRHILKTEQKALEINLDDQIYGTFAEIGAGQEVARNFFQAGGAAGTIAKTMSAYDKTYSDAIYGAEDSGRYVCENRLIKMLDHEYDLLQERLGETRCGTKFFVFADTVAAINYKKTIRGDGWLGLRFLLKDSGHPNDIAIHVKMLDNDNRLQQEAIGVLGVNLMYACYNYADNPEELVASLIDGIKDRVLIDMIRISGPDFQNVDNRLICLYMVKHGLTEVAMFDGKGRSFHGSANMYKKSLMVVRGNYKPPTLVTMDVLKTAFAQFKNDNKLDDTNATLITELPFKRLIKAGKGEINEADYLERCELLGALGLNVMVTNCSDHLELINYLSDFKIKKLGIVIGVKQLEKIITNKYEENKDGRLLVAFGELFTRNIIIYGYPARNEVTGELMKAGSLDVPQGIKFLYQHLVDSEHIVEVQGYDEDLLKIWPQRVHDSIANGDGEWKNMLPKVLVEVVKAKNLLNYKKKILASDAAN